MKEDFTGTVCIPLTRGKHALIDVDDFELVIRHDWYCTTNGYAIARGHKAKQESLYMHRLVLGTPKGMATDHINHDRLDNRRRNLRVCTIAENSRNTKAIGGTSKYKGVSWERARIRWKASIHHLGKNIEIGFYLSEHKAALAYNRAAKQYFGEFAHLNKVPKHLVNVIAPYRPSAHLATTSTTSGKESTQ